MDLIRSMGNPSRTREQWQEIDLSGSSDQHLRGPSTAATTSILF